MWEEADDASMTPAFARHDLVLRETIERHGGHVISSAGDGVAAAFGSAGDALSAAVEAQEQLLTDDRLRARMGLHTDEGRLRSADEYVNRPVNRCARLMAVAHGGQILVSSATAAVGAAVAAGVGLRDLGEHRLRDLAEPMRIFQVVHAPLPSEFPPLRSLEAVPGNLPRQLTSFVGREQELAGLGELVRQRSLVTLTGVGGVGKTRLAVQAAADAMAQRRDGAFIVELGSVGDPEVVGEVAAATLGVTVGPLQSPTDAVVGHLEQRDVVLVLDNCEHLLDAAAAFAASVESGCPGVTVLATSREPLGVPGERVVLVRSLALPDADVPREVQADAESVRLLVDRAENSRAGFEATPETIDALTHICRRLDGIPLALELAAARFRVMSPTEVAGHLDQRFRLLTGGSRIGSNRHQTLRRTIDWSYDLLEEDERRLLQRVAVFAGGFDLEAAETVSGSSDAIEVLDGLARLADKSLLLVDEVDASTRYRLLETIREYALERLAQVQDLAAVRRLHAQHYAHFAAVAGGGLRGRDERAWLERCERELDNLRAAVIWAIEVAEPQLASELVAPLTVAMLRIDMTVGAWAEAVANMAGASDTTRFAEVAAFASLYALRRRDFDASVRWRHAARAAVPDGEDRDRVMVRVLESQMVVDMQLEGQDAWIRTGEQRLDAARAYGNDTDLARAFGQLATAHAVTRRDPRLALSLAQESRVAAQSSGNATAIAGAALAYALALGHTDATAMLTAFDEAEHAALDGGSDSILMIIRATRSAELYALGHAPEALRAIIATTEAHVLAGYDSFTIGYLPMVAGALAAGHHDEPATILLGFFHANVQLGMVLDEASPWFQRTSIYLDPLPERLGHERYAQLLSEGATFPDVASALAYARAAVENLLAAQPPDPTNDTAV
jgi:predicted ATPase